MRTPMALAGQSALTLYPLEGCSFGTKGPKAEKYTTLEQRLARLEVKYTTSSSDSQEQFAGKASADCLTLHSAGTNRKGCAGAWRLCWSSMTTAIPTYCCCNKPPTPLGFLVEDCGLGRTVGAQQTLSRHPSLCRWLGCDPSSTVAEAEGLKRKLTNALSAEAASLAIDWQIGECVAAYWRPHFEPHMYPYLPVHITRPKEVKKLYTVQLPERCYFAVSF